MKPLTKLFLILLLAGFCGVLSFQFVDLTALIALMPGAADAPMPVSAAMLRVLTVVQTTVLLAVAVLVGTLINPKVGLSAPVAEALTQGRPWLPALRPQIIPGLVGGTLGALAIVGSWMAAKPFLPAAFTSKAEAFNRLMPLATRLLYGGIVEELLLRWGFMSLLVWLTWKLAQRGRVVPATSCFVTGIVVSSAVFGAGHFPIAFALAGGPSAALVAYILGANASFGLIAGYLFWKKGLESAILAHMVAHLIMVAALAIAPTAARA